MSNLKILTSTLLILFTISSTSGFCTELSNTNTTNENFANLRNCLISNGVNEKNLFQRGSGSQYTELNWQWVLNDYVAPMAYLVPKKVADIQIAVRCCTSLKIRPVARCGGHAFSKDSYGDDRSLVIDLAYLNQITVDRKSMTCEIGAGSRIGHIYNTLWNKGEYMISAGMCPYVGIAGIGLGGGYGYFGRQLGLTVDNLLELEMVDANGNLLVINNSTNKNLFWALRGGGGGTFGITTKFKFRMYSAPKYISFAIYSYRLKDFSKFFYSWQKLITSNIPDRLSTYLSIHDGVISMEIYTLDWKKTAKVNFEPLLKSFSFPKSIRSTNNLFSYPELLLTVSANYYNDSLTSLPQLGSLRKYVFPGYIHCNSFFVNKIANKRDIAKFHDLITENIRFLNKDDYSTMFFEHYGGIIDTIPRTDTAFVHRGTLYNIQLKVHSNTIPTLNNLANGLKKLYGGAKDCLQHTESYQNYLNEDIGFMDRYFGENLRRLIQVKKRVDPENMFCNTHSVPPNFDYYV